MITTHNTSTSTAKRIKIEIKEKERDSLKAMIGKGKGVLKVLGVLKAQTFNSRDFLNSKC